MTTYLKDFIDYSKNGIAYFPIGTIEWHGNHLPIETDFLVAQKLCEEIEREISGYILPPFYLGTDKPHDVGGTTFFGMDGHLGKKLPGSLYYLDPERLYGVVTAIMNNLKRQGFKEIFIITGHAGSKHVEVLEKIAKEIPEVNFIDPYECLSDMGEIHHADEYEMSLLWACYPEEEAKSKKIEIPQDDDFVNYRGYDPREKASLETGQEMLNRMVKSCKEQIKVFLRK